MLSRVRREDPVIQKDPRKAKGRRDPTGATKGCSRAELLLPRPLCLGLPHSMFKPELCLSVLLMSPSPLSLSLQVKGKVQRKNFCFRLLYREASNFLNSFCHQPLSLLCSHLPALLPKPLPLKRRLKVCPAGRFLPRRTRTFAAPVVQSKGTRNPAAPGGARSFASRGGPGEHGPSVPHPSCPVSRPLSQRNRNIYIYSLYF